MYDELLPVCRIGKYCFYCEQSSIKYQDKIELITAPFDPELIDDFSLTIHSMTPRAALSAILDLYIKTIEYSFIRFEPNNSSIRDVNFPAKLLTGDNRLEEGFLSLSSNEICAKLYITGNNSMDIVDAFDPKKTIVERFHLDLEEFGMCSVDFHIYPDDPSHELQFKKFMIKCCKEIASKNHIRFISNYISSVIDQILLPKFGNDSMMPMPLFNITPISTSTEKYIYVELLGYTVDMDVVHHPEKRKFDTHPAYEDHPSIAIPCYYEYGTLVSLENSMMNDTLTLTMINSVFTKIYSDENSLVNIIALKPCGDTDCKSLPFPISHYSCAYIVYDLLSKPDDFDDNDAVTQDNECFGIHAPLFLSYCYDGFIEIYESDNEMDSEYLKLISEVNPYYTTAKYIIKVSNALHNVTLDDIKKCVTDAIGNSNKVSLDTLKCDRFAILNNYSYWRLYEPSSKV